MKAKGEVLIVIGSIGMILGSIGVIIAGIIVIFAGWPNGLLVHSTKSILCIYISLIIYRLPRSVCL
jgi:Co/Zn/Cd efflux system component